MDEIKPKFQCPDCHRGVLNRSAERCLFCGAALPEGMRLNTEEIAERETATEKARDKLRREWTQPHSPSKSSDWVGLGDAVDLLGDL